MARTSHGCSDASAASCSSRSFAGTPSSHPVPTRAPSCRSTSARSPPATARSNDGVSGTSLRRGVAIGSARVQEYGTARDGRRRAGARARRARGPDHQSRQGTVRRARRDEARPRPLLRRGRRAAHAHDGRTAGADQRSRRGPAARRSSRSASRQRAGVAGDDHRPDRQRHAVAGAVAADAAHVAGRSTSPAWASTSGPTAPTIPTTPTSCGWTSIPSRDRIREEAGRRLGAQGAARRARDRRLPKATGDRGCTCTSGSSRGGHLRRALRRGRRRAELRRRRPTSSPPRGRRRSAASGSSSTTTRTPRADRVRRVVVRARKGAQVSTPVASEELDNVDPDELTLASVPGRLERDGDPGAPSRAPQSLEPLLARQARPRERPPSRAVAAGLSEAAQ